MQKSKKRAAKRVFSLLFAVTALAAFAVPAAAADTATEPEVRIVDAATSAPKPENELFPVSVEDWKLEGEWTVIKTYTLSPDENPRDISRESFDRGGWRFACVDITQNRSESVDSKEAVEVVETSSETKDTVKMVEDGVLAATMDYDKDGYKGTLTLNAGSIATAVAGTKSTSRTVDASRTYPGLARNDVSSVPKTITDKNRTLELAGVTWDQKMIGTDEAGEPLYEWTAHANYSAKVTSSVATGYNVTAEYAGTVSRTLVGDTVYKVYFEGKPLSEVQDEDDGESNSGITTGVKPGGGSQNQNPGSEISGNGISPALFWITIIVLAGAVVYLLVAKTRSSKE